MRCIATRNYLNWYMHAACICRHNGIKSHEKRSRKRKEKALTQSVPPKRLQNSRLNTFNRASAALCNDYQYLPYDTK